MDHRNGFYGFKLKIKLDKQLSAVRGGTQPCTEEEPQRIGRLTGGFVRLYDS